MAEIDIAVDGMVSTWLDRENARTDHRCDPVTRV